ncbi:MAG: NAD-dependent epimerase/dehydratase family protein [Spirochaetaceae bacterium]|nr:NAD-dependent epimerase/dehydratase family protein [Spirochaetaceae bacterium]
MTKQIIMGTGPLGLAIMDELLSRDQPVTLISRSGKVREKLPSTVELLSGDISDPHQVKNLCTGAEKVYFCAMPPYTRWPEEFPALLNGVIEGLAHSGTTLIYGDNLYMYGSTQGKAMTEDMPYKADSRKGKVRADLSFRLLEARKSGKLDVKILRGSDFFGPRVQNSSFGTPVFQAALEGKTVNLLGNPDLPHSITYIKDFARSMVLLADSPKVEPAVFHVPNAPVGSSRDFVVQVERELDMNLKIRATGKKMATFLGLFIPIVKEMKEMIYQWDEPFIADHSLFSSHFDFTPTPRDVAIKETALWYLTQKQKGGQ